MKRTRILVLPSWYPTQRNPTVGCFFQEQAALLSSEFDVRVLVGEAHPVGYRSAWRQWRWVPRPRRARVTRIAESEPGQTPHTAILEYHWRSTTEMDALAATVDAHAQAIEIWHRSGWRADLIHALSAEDGGVTGLQLARRFGLPMVLTEHQVFSPVHHSAEKRRRILEALNEANILIAVSNHQLRCLYLQGVERPMLVVGNLIDETAFPFQPVKVRDVFRILSITYPDPIKDCDTLFRSIAEVVRRGHHDIQLTVIGNNSFADLRDANVDAYRKLAANYKVESVCHFVAYAPRSEIVCHLAACDLFVSTSIAETFGVAVREAMAVGRPVVCTASGGVEDSLSPENGLKANIGDHEAVADAIIRIKTGAVRFDPLAIRASVVSRHGRATFLAQIREAYRLACTVNPT